MSSGCSRGEREIAEVATGLLPCGLKYTIQPSAKKAPGLVEGDHYIAVIDNNDLSADEVGTATTADLLELAFQFAIANADAPGKYRLAMNGGSVGTRSHLHIHIMLPRGADKLDTLVAR